MIALVFADLDRIGPPAWRTRCCVEQRTTRNITARMYTKRMINLDGYSGYFDKLYYGKSMELAFSQEPATPSGRARLIKMLLPPIFLQKFSGIWRRSAVCVACVYAAVDLYTRIQVPL